MGFTKEEAKQRLSEVISRFNRWQKEGRLNNEDDIKDLTQELFEKVLGWDKDDIYRERHPGPTSKRVDLQFRINGAVKLLLETKAIGVPWDKTVLRQAISYGWGSNEEYVILTNFQKIVLFNAKWKDEDKKIFSIDNIEECLTSEQKLEFLLLLNKESFETGKIDEFSESTGKKLKKSQISTNETIEKQLLNDLKKWREMLTNNIKTLNKLSIEEVDDTVQKIINRLIFIRVCEDRGLEPEFPELRSHLRIWSEKKDKTLIEALVTIFHHFDDVYDGTIFQKNDLCEKISIHNNVLERIIEELYVAKDMNTEYNFSSINADVLGSVYEQYLGYLLRGKKVSESHAHKKESGIYYTPTYIVDYIVRNTLGEVLKQKKDIDKIKVLDPACGSGSFLIKVFDGFSDFWKAHIGEDKFNRQIKNNILTNNIYGVDLDPKAVEISQLNLFLKIGEKGELPKLRQNIRCGNSLIDDKSIAGDKSFDWNEKFVDIMNSGGFDVMVGNPPYINVDILPKNERDFLKKFECYSGKSDILYYFYNKGISLLKPNGILGFITSRYFLEATYAKNLRKYILQNCDVLKIIDLSNLPVFKDVGIHTVVLILRKKSLNEKVKLNNKIFYKEVSEVEELNNSGGTLIDQSTLDENGWLLGGTKDLELFNRITSLKTATLGDISVIEQGQKTGLNEAFTVTEDTINRFNLEIDFIRKLVKNSYIEPYFIRDKKLYIIYASDEMNPKIAPNIIDYLHKFYNDLKSRAEARDGLYPWYRFQRPRSKELFDVKEKIIVPYRAEFNKFGYDDKQRFNDGGDVRIIVVKDPKYSVKYILAILNSKLMNYYYRFIGRKKGRVFEYFVEPLKKIPIVDTDSKNKKMLIELVDRMIDLSSRLDEIEETRTSDKFKLEEEIETVKKSIDDIIYDIYKLTKEEKNIIEKI